jgi:hypothetical protein
LWRRILARAREGRAEDRPAGAGRAALRQFRFRYIPLWGERSLELGRWRRSWVRPPPGARWMDQTDPLAAVAGFRFR